MNEEMLKHHIEMMDCDQCRFATKALDFYDGKQLTHMVELLSDKKKGRRSWQNRGMTAMYRNITACIVEKSTMLFNKGRPQMVVEDIEGGELEDATFELNTHFDKAGFDEFLNNFDAVVRLLKTALILVQYDQEYECFIYDTLHRGNCSVVTYGPKRQIGSLCYIVEKTEKGCYYRTFDSELVQDWYVEENDVRKVSEEDNVYGMVPAVVVHDCKAPRDGFWNYIPQDLVCFNEQYNLYLTDTIFAASHANRKSLFTNVEFAGEGDGTTNVTEVYGEGVPREMMQTDAVLYGPDRIVQVDSSGVENPVIEFKGPDIELTQIREMFQALTKDIASDWSVRIKTDGEGSANSGFQVVVEEMDNLELRAKRQQNMEGGLIRLYSVMMNMINVAEGRELLPTDSLPMIEFNDPSLPYEKDKMETLWITRIDNGLASRVDYVQDKYNVSREEAVEILQRIDEDNSNNPLNIPEFIDEV